MKGLKSSSFRELQLTSAKNGWEHAKTRTGDQLSRTLTAVRSQSRVVTEVAESDANMTRDKTEGSLIVSAFSLYRFK